MCELPQSEDDCFNPRLHAGGDMALLDQAIDDGWFQSTPPRGRRPTLEQVYNYLEILFQSTPPRGRRRQFETRAGTDNCFNPRLHAGGDREC